jgi:flagellar biosynthesis/type III secretory pathway protein FliH
MPLIKANNVPMTSAAFSMADIEQHARQILARAKAQADQIVADANAYAAKAKAGAAVEGKAAGIEQGRKEGREQAIVQARNQALTEQKAKLVETIGVLSKAAKELDARAQTLTQDARTELIPLALAIARRVTRLSGERDVRVVEGNVKEAIRLVMNKQSLRVAIHPTQKRAVDALLPQLKLQWPAMVFVEVLEDATVTTGGCKVYSAGGSIDADLDAQIDRIANELACEAAAVATPASPAIVQPPSTAQPPPSVEASLAPTKINAKP